MRDQRIGVIGWGKKAAGLALKLLQWTDDVIVFTHGHAREWDKEEHSKLLAEHIDVKDEKVIALIGNDANVEAASSPPARTVFFFNTKPNAVLPSPKIFIEMRSSEQTGGRYHHHQQRHNNGSRWPS